MTLEISIIVPDRVFWESNAEEVILPTLNGQMGVLTNHIPVLTGLDTGLILVRNNTSPGWTTLVVTGGLALVSENKIKVLVNEAEFGSDIDVKEAEDTYLAIKAELENNSDVKRIFELTSKFKKAKARFQVSQLPK